MDARSDIFSFGSVLYEMVTGQRAFQGDSKMSILAAVLNQEPKPASEISRALPRDLEKIITRCLRKDPSRRFQRMADLKVALEELKEESDSGLPAVKEGADAQESPGVLATAVGGTCRGGCFSGRGRMVLAFPFGTGETGSCAHPRTSYN